MKRLLDYMAVMTRIVLTFQVLVSSFGSLEPDYMFKLGKYDKKKTLNLNTGKHLRMVASSNSLPRSNGHNFG